MDPITSCHPYAARKNTLVDPLPPPNLSAGCLSRVISAQRAPWQRYSWRGVIMKSPESQRSQTACYKRKSRPITDHRSQAATTKARTGTVVRQTLCILEQWHILVSQRRASLSDELRWDVRAADMDQVTQGRRKQNERWAAGSGCCLSPSSYLCWMSTSTRKRGRC